MTDDDMIEAVASHDPGLLRPGVEAARLALFEKKLGKKLPPLLKAFLLRANGGESLLARCDRPFVPDELETFDKKALQAYVGLKAGLLPLGDDYGGDIVAVDLGSAPAFRVLIDDEEVAPTFREYVAEALAGVDAPVKPALLVASTLLAGDEVQSQAVAKVLRMPVRTFRFPDESREPRLFHEIQAKGVERFRFRIEHRAVPAVDLGYWMVALKAGHALLRVEGAAFVTETFKTAILLSAATAKLGPPPDDPYILPDGLCRQSKASAALHIFETDFVDYTEPPLGGARTLAVVLLKDGVAHRLRFAIFGLSDAAHSNAAINFLLGFGFTWLLVPDFR